MHDDYVVLQSMTVQLLLRWRCCLPFSFRWFARDLPYAWDFFVENVLDPGHVSGRTTPEGNGTCKAWGHKLQQQGSLLLPLGEVAFFGCVFNVNSLDIEVPSGSILSQYTRAEAPLLRVRFFTAQCTMKIPCAD
jgi:hypothetical protein